MKTLGFIIAAVLAAIFFPIYIHQLHKTNEAQATAASLQLQVTELENRVSEQEN